MRHTLISPDGITRKISGRNHLKDIDPDRKAIFILDDEDILSGYTTDGKVSDTGEVHLTSRDTGMCIGILFKRIVGWSYF